MTPTTTRRSNTSRVDDKRYAPQAGTGISDVTRTTRTLARDSLDLVTDAGEVLERELAMAVSLSERLRDETVSQELLREARSLRIQSEARDSAHRMVDLVADAVGVATVSVTRFAERLAEEPRRPLSSREDEQEEGTETSA